MIHSPWPLTFAVGVRCYDWLSLGHVPYFVTFTVLSQGTVIWQPHRNQWKYGRSNAPPRIGRAGRQKPQKPSTYVSPEHCIWHMLGKYFMLECLTFSLQNYLLIWGKSTHTEKLAQPQNSWILLLKLLEVLSVMSSFWYFPPPWVLHK